MTAKLTQKLALTWHSYLCSWLGITVFHKKVIQFPLKNLNPYVTFNLIFSHIITGYFDGYAYWHLSVNWPVTWLSIHQNHNNPWDNGSHSLMITRQMPTKASDDVYVPKEENVLNYYHLNNYIALYFQLPLHLTTGQIWTFRTVSVRDHSHPTGRIEI